MARIEYRPNAFDEFTMSARVDGSTIQECVKEFIKIHPDYAMLLSKSRLDISLNDEVLGPDVTWLNLPVFGDDHIFMVPSFGAGVSLATVLYQIGIAVVVAAIGGFVSYQLLKPDDTAVSNKNAYGFDRVDVIREGDPIPLPFGTTRVDARPIGGYIESATQFHRKYEKAGANTFTMTAGVHSGYTDSFTVTKAGTNNAIDGIWIPVVHPDFQPPTDLGYGVFTHGLPVRFKYRTNPDSAGWSDWQEVTLHETSSFFIDELTEANSYEVEVTMLDVQDHGFNTYDNAEEVATAEENYESDFVTFDDVKCKCKIVDHVSSELQQMSLLLNWGLGEIEGVRELYINDQAISNYTDENNQNGSEIVTNHRFGTPDQTTLPGFDSTIESVSGSFPYDLPDNTDSATVSMPAGSTPTKMMLGFKVRLFNLGSEGKILMNEVDYKVETSEVGADSWTELGTFTVKGKNSMSYDYKSITFDNLTPGRYDVRVTRVSDETDSGEAEFYWQYLNIFTPIGYTHPGLALTAMRFLGSEKISNSQPKIHGIIDGLKITVPEVTVGGVQVRFADCWWDSYSECYRHIGTTEITPDSAGVLTGSYVSQWSPNQFWIYYTGLTDTNWGLGDKIPASKVNLSEILDHGKWADELVSVDVSATGELDYTSGTTFGASSATVASAGWTVDAYKGKYVKVTSGTYADQIRRIASNTSDTLTLHTAWSDTPSAGDDITIFKQMIKRFEFHGVLESSMKVFDFFSKLLFTARSAPACIGTSYTVISDRVRDPVGIMNMGNIGEGSFSEHTDFRLPTHFRGTFKDANNNYETTSYELISNSFEAGDKIIPVSYDFSMGTHSLDRLVRELSFIRDKTENCVSTISCKVGLDQILGLPGDTIIVSHRAPEWGWGGRVKSGGTDAGGDYITLDEPVTLYSGKVYQLKVRIDDVIETYEVDEASTGTGSVSKIYIDDSWTTSPERFSDLWVLQNTTDEVEGKLFTYIEISRDNNNHADVILLEYNESVYDDGPVMPTRIVSGRLNPLPPALKSVEAELVWKLENYFWVPYVQMTFELDEEAHYSNVPIVKGKVYAHLEDGDLTGSPPDNMTYELSWEVMSQFAEYPVPGIDDKTAFVTACLVDTLGREGRLIDPVDLFIDTKFTPPIVAGVEVDATKGDSGYDYYGDHYSAYVKWNPVGWELDGALYTPILDWNSGNNYYNFASYVVVWGIVDNTGDYPALSELHFYSMPNGIGSIFNPDGSAISDAATLDQICRDAMQLRVDGLGYSSKYIAWTVAAVMKNGHWAIDATQTSPADYGLDWDWVQVQGPSDSGLTVEDVQVTNAEIYYKMVPNAAHVCEIRWDYTLSSPTFDGFAIMWRYQPYQWLWATNAQYLVGATGRPSLDTASIGGSDAYLNLVAMMTQWKAKGILYCFFLITDATNHEVIRVDLTATDPSGTWVVERGQEGTTARTWSTGAWVEYACSEYVDQILFVEDTAKRSIVMDKPLVVNQALHCSIVAYKWMDESPGYKRSNLAFWETLDQG